MSHPDSDLIQLQPLAMDFSSLKDQVSNLTLYDLKAGVRKVQNGALNPSSPTVLRLNVTRLCVAIPGTLELTASS